MGMGMGMDPMAVRFSGGQIAHRCLAPVAVGRGMEKGGDRDRDGGGTLSRSSSSVTSDATKAMVMTRQQRNLSIYFISSRSSPRSPLHIFVHYLHLIPSTSSSIQSGKLLSDLLPNTFQAYAYDDFMEGPRHSSVPVTSSGKHRQNSREIAQPGGRGGAKMVDLTGSTGVGDHINCWEGRGSGRAPGSGPSSQLDENSDNAPHVRSDAHFDGEGTKTNAKTRPVLSEEDLR